MPEYAPAIAPAIAAFVSQSPPKFTQYSFTSFTFPLPRANNPIATGIDSAARSPPPK